MCKWEVVRTRPWSLKQRAGHERRQERDMHDLDGAVNVGACGSIPSSTSSIPRLGNPVLSVSGDMLTALCAVVRPLYDYMSASAIGRGIAGVNLK